MDPGAPQQTPDPAAAAPYGYPPPPYYGYPAPVPATMAYGPQTGRSSLAVGVIWLGVALGSIAMLESSGDLAWWMLDGATLLDGLQELVTTYPMGMFSMLLSIFGGLVMLAAVIPALHRMTAGLVFMTVGAGAHGLANLLWVFTSLVEAIELIQSSYGLELAIPILMSQTLNTFFRMSFFAGWIVLLWLPATRDGLGRR